jgi:hypothetical protein
MLVQAVLFAGCCGVLYVKKRREDAKLGNWSRTWMEFGLDCSKQFAGCGWLHVLNLFFATLQDKMLTGGDQCSWYWINIMVDTTLGTAVEYFLLKVSTAVIRKRGLVGFQSGDYKAENGTFIWTNFFKQLAVWLLIVSMMKILMVLVMFLFSGPLLGLAGVVLNPFLKEPALKLLVVMIFFPILMDGFQLWVTDNFIKKREHRPIEGSEQDEEQDEERAMASFYAEASADALLNFSATCEEATENTLRSMRAKCKEALAEANKRKEEQDVDFGDDEEFQTKYNFVTRVPMNVNTE